MNSNIQLLAKENLYCNLNYRNSCLMQARKQSTFLNEKNKPINSFGKRWDKYAAWTLKNIENFLSVKEAIEFAQTRHGFELRECDNLHEAIANWEKKVKTEFSHYSLYFDYFSEPEYLSNKTIIKYNGRLMSSMLCHLIRFHFAILSYCNFPDIICEIGGGYGAPARIWMNSPIFQPQIYIIIDLSESLFFSECFLRNEFLDRPDLKIINFAGHKDLPLLEKGKQYIFLCPTERIELLTKLNIDVVINTLSMQEMSQEWVDIYMKWLDRTKAKNFYSFNAFMTPINKMHEVTNVYCPRPSQQWLARISNFPYPEGPAAEIVYDRVDDSSFHKLQAIKNNKKIYEKFIPSINERESYVKLIEALRYLNSKELVFKFVSLFLETEQPIPKEIVYFCDMLVKEKNLDLRSHRLILQLQAKLQQIRQSGEEAAVDAFVDV